MVLFSFFFVYNEIMVISFTVYWEQDEVPKL